jgi:predicted Zn-dependent peptidase
MSSVKLHRQFNRTLQEEIITTRFSCGLRGILLPKPGMNKKIAIAATRYGSIDLTFEVDGRKVETPPGIAHFLEHQLFKKEKGDLLVDFGEYGASSNAFTEYCSTAYYFLTSGQYTSSLDLLLKLAWEPYFNSEYVDKERQIIEQELRMYDDAPDYRIYKNLMSGLYQKHPIRLDVGGEVSDIAKIDVRLLEDCYRVFYHPENMVLILAGDLDAQETFDHVESRLPKKFSSLPPSQRFLPEEPEEVAKRMSLEEMAVSRPSMLIGFKEQNVADGDHLRRDIEMSMVLDLLFGRGSDFYQKHYATGLINDSFSSSYNSDLPYGFTLIGGETDHPEKLEEEVRKELQSMRKKKFQEQDVERVKRKRTGRYIRAFDSPDGAAFLILGCVQKGIDVFDVTDAISRVTPDLLKERFLSHFNLDHYAVSVIAPSGQN